MKQENIQEKQKSNADRIRSMTDEELAELFFSFQNLEDKVKFCKNKDVCFAILDDGYEIPDAMCKKCLVEWLQSEADQQESHENEIPEWKDRMMQTFLGRR